MHEFLQLLRTNRNYRYTWMGQIVSEIGDHFNTIAVFSLILDRTGSGTIISAVMLARAIPMMMAGPVAGVSLDRFDRRKLMLGSDLVRGVLGLLFILTVTYEPLWPIYVLSGALMFASPFFTSGRTAILPTITSPGELHAANSLTQTTKYMTVTLGTLLGGVSAASLGFEAAFLINGLSFLFSGWMIWLLRVEKGHFRPERKALTEQDVAKPWKEYRDGLRYLASKPSLLGIALLQVGWACGGGAAQILFSMFGEIVFDRGPTGIGVIWSAAGFGLVVGSAFGHWAGKRVDHEGYKKLVGTGFVVHGLAYILFSQAPTFWIAFMLVGLSRTGVGLATVLNQEQLLRHVDDGFRGRVYSTIETMTWTVMMLSLTAAGVAADLYSPRTIGAVAGCFGLLTGVVWLGAHWRGLLPEPPLQDVDPDDYEVRTQPRM